MLYFGFDPSLTCTGLCLVDGDGKYIDSDKISTTNTIFMPMRIRYIFDRVEEIVGGIKKDYPYIRVGMELPITKMYKDDLLVMVKTCLWLSLVKYEIPFVCFTPTHIQNYMKESGPQFNYSSKSTGTCKLSSLFLSTEGVSDLCEDTKIKTKLSKKVLVKLQKDKSDAFMVARFAHRFWMFYDLWNVDNHAEIAKVFSEKERDMFGSSKPKKSKKKVKVPKGIIHNKGLEYFTFDHNE